jgi:hypothetical protein
MKSIFDSSFKYRPSFDTNVRETFFRARREQQAKIQAEEPAEIPQEQASGDSSGAARY